MKTVKRQTVNLTSVVDFRAQYEAWFGEPDHEIETEYGNIFVYSPGDADDDDAFWTYVTGGLSLNKMTVAEGSDSTGRAELLFYAKEPDERYVAMLTLLMVFPFVDQTWIEFGHTVALDKPLDDAGVLTAVVLLYTLFTGHRKTFESVTVDGESVEYLWIVPISEQERQLKKREGVNGLLDVLGANNNPVIFPGARDSYV